MEPAGSAGDDFDVPARCDRELFRENGTVPPTISEEMLPGNGTLFLGSGVTRNRQQMEKVALDEHVESRKGPVSRP
ncbi:MAG: hypothetical protein DWQ09_11650 [Proteobacteria bacterium]|nr:MAG: hypothetical protein DWQ09_11650 [Pseudomonadota bacterium]